MNRKFRHLSFGAIILICAAVNSFADQTVKQRMTVQGQTFETTVMIKGARQRSESSMGGEAGKFMPKVATVTQCDLRRTLQMNDAKRLYVIQSMAEDVPEIAPASGANSGNKASVGGAERGGVVVMSYTVTDTGERKQMFGMTARHIKTVMTVEPSPGACQKETMRMETDGWYVDLPGFSCPLDRPQVPQLAAQANDAGCQDRTRYKTSGSAAKLGFPLSVTTTIFDQSGKPQTTMTTETLELSSATLDAALFDVPKGYTQASSAQDLYKFDPAEMIRQMGDDDPNDDDGDEPPAVEQ